MDKELLKIIFEDLEYIIKEWNKNDVSDANLRCSSNILRRLLIDKDLFKIARLFNMKELRILSYEEVSEFPLNTEFYQAGGGKYKGGIVEEVLILNKVLTAKEIKDSYKKRKKKKPINLYEFMKQPSIIIQNQEINREEIIKYVCNKLGGVHYDKKRKKDNILEKKYKLLDKLKTTALIMDKEVVYFELLSIGQRLVNSKDIQKLKKRIKNYL